MNDNTTSMGKKFPVNDDYVFTVDFTTRLPDAVTISSISVTSRIGGTDTTVTFIKTATNDTKIVTVTCQNGLPHEEHRVKVTMIGSDGLEKTHLVIVTILEAP